MDIDQLHIDKIYELDTTEPNGVEVKIPLSSFNANELDCLSFIDNIYVECDGDYANQDTISEFNKRKIHTYKNFKTITYEYRHSNDKTEILLGKIPYAVDYMSLWDYEDDWHKSWKESMKSIYPCINIGEVDITPNRETLIYSDRTKERLIEAYDNCIAELTECWNNKCDVEYNDFYKWADEISKWRRNELELDELIIPISGQLPFNAKFEGHPEWNTVDPKEKKRLVGALMNSSLETLGQFSSGTIYKGRREVSIQIKHLLSDWLYDKYGRDRIILAVPSQNGFSSRYFKDFLSFKYHDKSILFLRRQRISASELRGYIRRIWGVTMITDTTYCHFVVSLLKELYRNIKAKSTYEDIMSSPEYQQYKKEHQNPKTYVARHTGKINFTIIDTAHYDSYKKNITIDELLKYLTSEFKRRQNVHQVVYSTLDSPFLAAFHKIAYPNLVIISAAKNNMKYLTEGLPEWIKPIESLYTPDNRVLIKYKTAKLLHEKCLKDFCYEYYQVMPKWVDTEMTQIRSYMYTYDIYRDNRSYSFTDATSLLDIIPEDSYDYCMIGRVRKLKPYLELSYKIAHNLNLYSGNPELQYYLLMKAKKVRPCYTYYKRIREKVSQILEAV